MRDEFDDAPNGARVDWRRVGDDAPTETEERRWMVWETREVRERRAREVGRVDAGDVDGGDGGDGGDGWTKLEGFAVGVRGVGARAARADGFEGERWRWGWER